MQKLQLYIESDRLDLFKDESVSLTETIQNIKDVAKIFTSFSKTFSVPASPNNNKIFKHYYNFDIIGGYDARLKKAGRIELNTIPFKSGRIKLEGVNLKNNLAHTYKITFFGNTVELPDVLGDDKLGSLLFGSSDYDLNYDFQTIRAYLISTQNTGKLIVPLITHTQRLFYSSAISSNQDNIFFTTQRQQGVFFNSLKFAIRLYELILEIEAKYTIANGYANNILFSRDFFNTSNPAFYNLYMWLHRKSGAVQPPQQVVNFQTSTPSWTGTISKLRRNGNTIIIPATAVTNPNGISSNSCVVTPNNNNDEYQVIISNNGQAIFTSPIVTGVQNFNQTPLVADGVYTVTIQHETVVVITSIVWTFNGFEGTSSNTWTEVYSVGQFTASTVFAFDVRQQIPDVSIMSFLSGIFNMFNLVAYINDIGTIVVRPLEASSASVFDGTNNFSYYTDDDISGKNAPVNYNISEFVDTTKSEVNIALPYRQINYSYEGTGTFLAKQHNQLFGTVWGALSYIGGTDETGTGGINYDASTEVYKVLVPFEHMKFERLIDANNGQATKLQWGYSVNENQQPYIGKPLIFYASLEDTTSAGYQFRQDDNTSQKLTKFWLPSNSLYLSANLGKENINFGNEFNEYAASSNEFTDTLFAVYHSKYIIDVFNLSRRLTKVTSYLPLRILYNFELNDTFQINTQKYIINSITTNLQSGKSEMELLNKV